MSNLSIKFWSVLLIINLILTGSLLHATVFFDEDFSGGSTPANWDNNALQGSQNWTIQSSPAMASTSGGYYAVFDDYALGASVTPNEAALVTNPLDFSGHTNIKINYEHYWEGVEGTHGYVELSTDGGSTWTTVMDYEKNTRGSLTAPQDTTLDISTYAANESNVKIRFRYNDGGYAGRYWYMDDVTVYSDPDVGITQLVEPAPLNCGESFTASEPLTVRIHNFSHEPVSNVPVILEIQGGLTVTFNETYTGTIPAESYVDFTLSSAVDMSADAAYHFNIQTDLASDAFPSN
ncbi:MAG: choice-of-anchor J domain-containing protein, partial [Bacteroidales bacterium]